MTADKPDPHYYARTHDAQATRTRVELWIVLGVVVVVLAGSLIWRAVTGHPAGPQTGWRPAQTSLSPTATDAAAGAGVAPTPARPGPAPRPASPL